MTSTQYDSTLWHSPCCFDGLWVGDLKTARLFNIYETIQICQCIEKSKQLLLQEPMCCNGCVILRVLYFQKSTVYDYVTLDGARLNATHFCCWFKGKGLSQLVCVFTSATVASLADIDTHSLLYHFDSDCLSPPLNLTGPGCSNQRTKECWILKPQTWWDLQSQHNHAAQICCPNNTCVFLLLSAVTASL